jgi:hypothetical protein
MPVKRVSKQKGTLVKKVGVVRPKNKFVYVDKKGYIAAFDRKTKKKGIVAKYKKFGPVEKKEGYLTFIGSDGNIREKKLNRKGRKSGSKNKRRSSK